MIFTRKLLIVLTSVWLMATAIAIASEAMAFHFQPSQTKATLEAAKVGDPDSAEAFPPFVRLTENAKEYLQKYNNAAKYTGLAVNLVRDQINHLYSGNFAEARKDWHPEGQVHHNFDQYITHKDQAVHWSYDRPFHRSASQYIDILEKQRRHAQINRTRPRIIEGPWSHSFSTLAVTVLDVHSNGVLISVNEPGVIDFCEPNSLENPIAFGTIFGYRSMLFTVQVGRVLKQNVDNGPEADFSDVEYRVRLQNLSLSPESGC